MFFFVYFCILVLCCVTTWCPTVKSKAKADFICIYLNVYVEIWIHYVDIAISCLNMTTSLCICFNFGAFAFLIGHQLQETMGRRKGWDQGMTLAGFELRSPKHKLQCRSMWITPRSLTNFCNTFWSLICNAPWSHFDNHKVNALFNTDTTFQR